MLDKIGAIKSFSERNTQAISTTICVGGFSISIALGVIGMLALLASQDAPSSSGLSSLAVLHTGGACALIVLSFLGICITSVSHRCLRKSEP